MPKHKDNKLPAEPWHSFLSELDDMLDQPVGFHCRFRCQSKRCQSIPSFARETADLDVLTVAPIEMSPVVSSLAGKGSPLHRKHRVYIDRVGVADFPDSYESRMLRAFPAWSKVRLWALEAHDLALTKLDRSNERDIRDVMFLANAGFINEETLVRRFEAEMEPYITGRAPTWHRGTLRMGIEACWPG